MRPVARRFILCRHLPSLLGLLEKRARAGLAEPWDENVIRTLAARPGSHSARDAVVVEDPDGKVIGWADVYLPPGARQADLLLAADLAVGREVRDALFDAAITRARAAGATTMLTYTKPVDLATVEFLNARGAQPVAGYVRLRAELAYLRPAPPLPTGWRLEPCSGQSGAELALAAAKAAWGDLHGHKPATPESVAMALEAFGPDGHLTLVDANGRAVGVVRSLLSEPGEGYVDAPGLAPDLRSRDSYAALLGAAVSRLISLGATRATLESWGDPPEAREAWERAGWEIEALEEGRLLAIQSKANDTNGDA